MAYAQQQGHNMQYSDKEASNALKEAWKANRELFNDLEKHNTLNVGYRLTSEQMNPAYAAVQKKQQAKAAEMDGKRQELMKEFLQANAAREGVTTTDSGLQYEVLEAGSGATPNAQSTVVTHYHGTLVDGTVFDSSLERGEPAEFGVTQVIAAWTEALLLMSVGDKWRIACPPSLAYGEQGAGDAIPPNTALVFEIHLIEIKG